MAGRETALSLLAAANNHGDLAMKLTSLKQAKDVLLSVEPSLAAELFPYLLELKSSPQPLVRETLIEVINEIVLRAIEHSVILIPALMTLLRDNDSIVATKAVVTGTNIFCSVLYELSLQFQRRGIVERWLEELWMWMVKFKNAVYDILLEGGSIRTKLVAIKFLETYILLFTSDAGDDPVKFNPQAVTENGRDFNVSWLVGGHPVLDPVSLRSDANKYIGFLLDWLRSASSLRGSLTIVVVNCLAAIARKRPTHCSLVLSALLDCCKNFERAKGGHAASIQYSMRTAFLGFLRSTHPLMLESRDKLVRALRTMNAGDAADQVMRQVDKMIKLNERASRDARFIKDEQTSEDVVRKRTAPFDQEEPTDSFEISKRTRYGSNTFGAPAITDSEQDSSVNGVSLSFSSLDSDSNLVERMIAMIGAFIAEGDRGAKSLEIVISEMQPDLLADIVITNMKHLPENTPPITRLGSQSVTRPNGSSNSQLVAPIGSTISVQSPGQLAQLPSSSSNAISTSMIETSVIPPSESKRDPRRDSRRLDPRRVAGPVRVPSTPQFEDNTISMQSGAMKSEFEAAVSMNKELTQPLVTSTENSSVPFLPMTESELFTSKSPFVSLADEQAPKEEVLEEEERKDVVLHVEDTVASDVPLSPVRKVVLDSTTQELSNTALADEVYSSYFVQADQLSPSVLSTPVSEEVYPDLPEVPLYVDLTEDQKGNVRKLAVQRIIDSCKHLQGTGCKQTRMSLLSRLVAQIAEDEEVVVLMQKHIVSDYQNQKGHELVIHILYHLHSLMLSDSVVHSFASSVYENFLLGVVGSLLETLPATDKSFSRLLGEVPFLPDSALKLLDDLCHSAHDFGKDGRDGDRVTQGLGAVWSLILGRPVNRRACLDIALKCAVHSQDDIRAKAIRLVTNKLYVINYISENIEQFAINMLKSTVESDAVLLQLGGTEQEKEVEIDSQETSISGSQISEAGISESDPGKTDLQSDSSMSFSQVQQHISLFFALCTKKPCLLQLVFDNYSRAPKVVKQAIHRHIPVLLRALGDSYSELLHIFSDPPQGSENLLTQVLNILSESNVPSVDLVATVRRLYDTKLKDAAILIPLLPSFSKNEVLPIFPRLVDLPLVKFQTALANILQGTAAHTGPALTPVEVLVAIHDINPDKDHIALKKITDACSACFEQRTVFTQQVLAKALNQMVDQTPLPMLFMRTVIQAIDAFPSLVDFVMEILSKLVNKQVWRMPKLWVGFLKCISQTQPHSFHVLLQLPSPQLEGALKKFANLRGPLAAYANQPSTKTSLPRSTLALLGLVNERHVQQQQHPSSLHSSETSSSIHGTT